MSLRRAIALQSAVRESEQRVGNKTVQIGTLTIGEGMPKICVGITGAAFDLVLDMHRGLLAEKADLLEWRTDYLLGGKYTDIEGINATLAKIAETDPRPVILTLRTESEGGQAALSAREYREIIRSYITESDAGIIDIEAFDKESAEGREIIAFLTALAHENGKLVILSNHDFNMTPSAKEILQRLQMMQDMGADIPKVAYMPQSEEDVHTLLLAAAEAEEQLEVPFIALSMGELGQPSRICGGTFGSCVSFAASASAATAPGQITADRLSDYLKQYYGENLE